MKTEEKDRFLIVHFPERVDSSNVNNLEKEILKVIEDAAGKYVILSCNRTTYMNSSGLRLFVLARRNHQNSEGEIAVTGANPFIKELLSVTGISEVIPVFENIEEIYSSV